MASGDFMQTLREQIANGTTVEQLLVKYCGYDENVHCLGDEIYAAASAYVVPEVDRIYKYLATRGTMNDYVWREEFSRLARQYLHAEDILQVVTMTATNRFGEEQFYEIARHNEAWRMYAKWLPSLEREAWPGDEFSYWLTGYYLVTTWTNIVRELCKE